MPGSFQSIPDKFIIMIIQVSISAPEQTAWSSVQVLFQYKPEINSKQTGIDEVDNSPIFN